MRKIQKYDLWYSEGPGTSCYRVLIDKTATQCAEFVLRFNWTRAEWAMLISQPTLEKKAS